MNRTAVLLVIGTLLYVAAIGLLIVFAAERAYEKAAAAEWPGELGALTAAPTRFPAVARNAAAERFDALASRLEAPAEAIEYLKREIVRADAAISPPPPVVVAHLTEQAAALDATRDHLLLAGELVWAHDPAKGYQSKLPSLAVTLRAARLLMIRALATGDGESLRAASRLVQPLLARPEAVPNMIGIAIVRDVVAVAAKLPAAVRPWINDIARADPERALARAMQYETWLVWAHGMDEAGREAGVAPQWYLHLMLANYVGHQRETLTPLLHVRNCDADMGRYFEERIEGVPRWNILGRIAVPSVGSGWGRAFRYRAEREATLNAIRAALGEPIVASSTCHGTWSSEVLPDGRIRVAYSKAIRRSGERDTLIPLVRITRVRTSSRST